MRKCATLIAVCVLLCASHDDTSADPHSRPSPGELAGKRILVSPGHGWTWQNTSQFWYTQRGVTNGMVEDFSNAMMVIDFLEPYLVNAGADVVIPRERSYQSIELIGDDGDANYFETGTWTQSSNVSGYWNTGYRYAAVNATETATAGWNFSVTEPGRYPVYVRWTPGTDRTNDALYRVHHAAGTAEVTMDQNQYQYTNPYDNVTETVHQGGRWVFLGEWELTPSSGCTVEVSNQAGTGSYVVVDACKVGGGMGSIDRGGGTSGRPRWEECSRYYAEFHGMPATVWDSSTDDGNDNVTTPSRMLKWWGDFDLHFALHSNASGGSGTARGTVTYTYNNASTPHPTALLNDSVDFAQLVQDECMRVNNAHAAANGDTWNDRGLATANFGELRVNDKTPACLLESAFHDNAQDAAYLRDPKWRHDTARAIYKAIVRYFNSGATIIPLPPTHLRMENTANGEITINWNPQADPLESGATPTGYRVYLSGDGIAFDSGRDASGSTSHTLTGLQPGETVFAKVTATNAGGESLESEVICARTPDSDAQGLAAPLLIVSGYDRLDEFTWYQQGAANTSGDMHVRNTRDSVVRHGLSAATATTTDGGSYFFDGASNEAVEDADIALGDYDVVDWVLGNESTVDETFSATEQTLVSAYLAAGGKLFASGGEIAWDLDQQGSGSDVTFYESTLGGSYVSDSSNDWTVDPVSGGLFDGLSSFSFDDGTGSSYTVDYPDVIEPSSAGSATSVLEYSPGSAAAIASGNVVLFGFPFETINEHTERDEVMQRILRQLAVNYTGINPNGSGGGDDDDDSGCSVSPTTGWASLLLLLIPVFWWRRRRV